MNEVNFNSVKNSAAFSKAKGKKGMSDSLDAILEQYEEEDLSIFGGKPGSNSLWADSTMETIGGNRRSEEDNWLKGNSNFQSILQ